VRAGLDLVAAVAELGTQAGVPGLAARAGVVTGEVAVTLGAAGEGMVAGDAVNTAARVQAAAEPRQVLTDGATQRLASAGVGFADAGERALKGKAEPVRLWRATWVLAGVGGAQRVDGLEAPLTGRDAELRMIKELLHAVADRRVPRLVLVSGPAGVGKSRLGWEFEKYADGLKADVWWHRGRCLSYGEGVAFWALAEIVRQRLGIAEEDPAEVAAAKLAAGLDRFVPDPGERAYAGVRLGRLLGVKFAGDAGRRHVSNCSPASRPHDRAAAPADRAATWPSQRCISRRSGSALRLLTGCRGGRHQLDPATSGTAGHPAKGSSSTFQPLPARPGQDLQNAPSPPRS
jgi:hypothetical protein